jgi:hypothetical protein
MRRRNELAVLPKLPLLITESAEEFDALSILAQRQVRARLLVINRERPEHSIRCGLFITPSHP